MQAGLGWILGDIDESSNPQKLLGAELFLRGGSQGEGQKFFALGPGAEILHSRRVQVYIYVFFYSYCSGDVATHLAVAACNHCPVELASTGRSQIGVSREHQGLPRGGLIL